MYYFNYDIDKLKAREMYLQASESNDTYVNLKQCH